MRIIAGKHRTRTLHAPKGLDTRPVLGNVREALFNVLGGVEELRVLDLFAGTGAVGIEALSRGAASLVLVEQAHAACVTIEKNLTLLGEKAEVIRGDVFSALNRLMSSDRTFDLIFADPPYATGASQRAVLAVLSSNLLTCPGLMAVTVRKNEIMPGDTDWNGQQLPDNASLVFDRQYGDTRLVIYRRDNGSLPASGDIPDDN
jgi:16S rRNA (guanine966-N2)-methyltransferase